GAVYGGIASNGTNNYIASDKNEEELVEPSIRRSSRPMKRVNYAEIDGSDEERDSRKIRRTNNATNSESAESPSAELTLEIGAEFANKLSSVRDTNPEIWTPDIENYIDNVLKKSGKQFKNAILVDVPDNLFRFYNLVDINPTIDKKIGERKYITYQISSIYKFYEKTFFNLDFDWIESHVRSAKITKSGTNSGIVK
ncbi:10810_t:CDS:2, partial [Racocetra fulgida]